MVRKKQAIDERVEREVKETIDIVLSTLYANDERGYFGVGMKPDQFKDQGIKRIQRKLSSLDVKAQEPLASDYKGRVARFDTWASLPKDQKDEVLRLAKERHISLEKAYELSGGARN